MGSEVSTGSDNLTNLSRVGFGVGNGSDPHLKTSKINGQMGWDQFENVKPRHFDNILGETH